MHEKSTSNQTVVLPEESVKLCISISLVVLSRTLVSFIALYRTLYVMYYIINKNINPQMLLYFK